MSGLSNTASQWSEVCVCVFVRVGDVDDGLVQKEGASRCASAAAGGGGDAFCRGV